MLLGPALFNIVVNYLDNDIELLFTTFLSWWAERNMNLLHNWIKILKYDHQIKYHKHCKQMSIDTLGVFFIFSKNWKQKVT